MDMELKDEIVKKMKKSPRGIILIKKIIRTWDPDYTKVTLKEKRQLDAADEELKAGEYIAEDPFWSQVFEDKDNRHE